MKELLQNSTFYIRHSTFAFLIRGRDLIAARARFEETTNPARNAGSLLLRVFLFSRVEGLEIGVDVTVL